MALTSVFKPGEDCLVDGDKHRSGSLLGPLELGLGAGFLRALDAPADQVGELVLDCVDRDPRELGGDSRADYYALLLLATGVSASAVQRLVIAHEPTTGSWDDGSELALDVLIRMAVRGDRRAQDAVIGYMARGVRWPHLLWELLEDADGRSMNIPSGGPRWRSWEQCCATASVGRAVARGDGGHGRALG
jgi:hypothetical protein